MITTITTKNKANVIFQSIGESLFQIMEYNDLKGYINKDTIKIIKEINESNMSLKQVRVVLKNSAIKIQDNSLSYLKGDIELKDKITNNISITKRLLGVKEKNVKSYLIGTGEVLFKPSFKYFMIVELEDEEIIINNEIFYICESSIKIDFESSKKIISNDKLSLKLSGSGIVILKLPVPESEIIKYKLFNDRLCTVNDCEVLRSSSIGLEVKEINTLSKEYKETDNNYISIYEGIGEVWILPTLNCYEEYDELEEYDEEN